MSIRSILGTVLLVALAICAAFILLSIFFLRGQVSALLPGSLALEVDGPLMRILLMQAVLLVVVCLILAVSIFWIVGSVILKPLRILSRAMDAYTATETREAVVNLSDAPTEIRSLASSFDALIERVSDSHQRDSEISRVKSDFISTAAHQFRTPLTGIRWALEALQKENLNENQKVLVDSAVDKSKDLVGIVGTLLDISAIESGKYKYDFKPVDMNAVLTDLVNDFSPVAAENKVTLFYAHEEGQKALYARADSDRIKWVLNNLIENAIVYTPAGGTVRVSLESAERRLFIRVKDSGIGIAPSDRANIFERFYRAENAIAKKNQGNGLGLYIARTIATDHGGDLNFAANTEGPGTTFSLSLPVA